MSIIKSISVGNGDLFYIKHGSSNFTIIDCNMDDTNKEQITAEIKNESLRKAIHRFIFTNNRLWAFCCKNACRWCL